MARARSTTTAKKTKCPVKALRQNPYCSFLKNPPKHLNLTPADKVALHQFARRIIVAGEMLYKKVPPEKAEPHIRRKWRSISAAIR